MASILRWAGKKIWSKLKPLTQNIDDSEFKIPWRSWGFAAFVVTTLYSIDLPDHARQYGEARERKRLDSLGMPNVQKELGDGRYLMRDGSIKKGPD
jgi:hypothetical protein